VYLSLIESFHITYYIILKKTVHQTKISKRIEKQNEGGSKKV
jgi:hypothetical protein